MEDLIVSDLIVYKIMLYLDETTINNFSQSTIESNYTINKVWNNKSYWKQKLELFIGNDYGDLALEWREIYNCIIRDLNDLDEAFKSAAKTGNLHAVEFLIIYMGINPSIDGNTAIELASEEGHVEIVRLLSRDDRVDASDGIVAASILGQIEVVKLLLTDWFTGVDLGSYGNEALIRASESGQIEVVELLLTDNRINPCTDNNQAIMEAIMEASYSGHIEVFKLLLTNNRFYQSLSHSERKEYLKALDISKEINYDIYKY